MPRLQRREAAFLEPRWWRGSPPRCPEPYDLLVRILGQLGPRFGEAAALRRRSVDLLRRRLLIAESLAEIGGQLIFGPTKTHATRRVPLTSTLAAALEAQPGRVAPDPAALVFTSPGGRRSGTALPLSGLAPGARACRRSAARDPRPASLRGRRDDPRGRHAEDGSGGPRARFRAFTLTAYGHIFDADLDDLAASLENLDGIQTG